MGGCQHPTPQLRDPGPASWGLTGCRRVPVRARGGCCRFGGPRKLALSTAVLFRVEPAPRREQSLLSEACPWCCVALWCFTFTACLFLMQSLYQPCLLTLRKLPFETLLRTPHCEEEGKLCVLQSLLCVYVGEYQPICGQSTNCVRCHLACYS